MWNYLAAAITLAVFTIVVGLIQKTYHRTADLPRGPYGVDADTDADLRRVLHDLDARR